MKAHARSRSAVTVIGFLLLVGAATLTLCALLYISRKALSAAKTIERQRAQQITNEFDLAQMPMPVGIDEPWFIETPSAVWTDLGEGWWSVDIPDAEFIGAALEYRAWRILAAPDCDGPWLDIGRVEWGNPESIRQMLFQQCVYEGPLAASDGGNHAGTVNAFYMAVPLE
jgi:hypothetical protein